MKSRRFVRLAIVAGGVVGLLAALPSPPVAAGPRSAASVGTASMSPGLGYPTSSSTCEIAPFTKVGTSTAALAPSGAASNPHGCQALELLSTTSPFTASYGDPSIAHFFGTVVQNPPDHVDVALGLSPTTVIAACNEVEATTDKADAVLTTCTSSVVMTKHSTTALRFTAGTLRPAVN